MSWSSVSLLSALSGLAGVENRSDVGSTLGEYTYIVDDSTGGCSCFKASSLADRTCAATSACSASRPASSSIPSSIRNRENVRRQSRSASESRSALGLYLDSSSDIECEYGRVTSARTNAGPLLARQYATASFRIPYDST